MFTLYNVVSADGYITKKDGDESFIPDSLWPTVLNIFKRYKVFLMGSKTYEAFQNYGDALLDPFEKLDLRKVAVSRNKNFKTKVGYEVVETAEEILPFAKDTLISSGSIFNNYLFENNLIGTVILHQLEPSLGEGIRPFDEKYFKDFILISDSKLNNVREFIYKKSNIL